MPKTILAWLFVSLLAPLAVTPITANAAPYEAGVDYKVITPPQPTDSANQIQVIELFWYGCPHCHHFIPYVDRWLKHKPANVDFELMPAVLRPEWEVHARFYYAEQALGLTDKLHVKLFDAIHDERLPLYTEDALLDWVAKQGVDRQSFADAMHSFAVNLKVNRAREMGRRYGVDGTPAVIVDGKYRIEPGMNGADFKEMLKVVNFLVKKEQMVAGR